MNQYAAVFLESTVVQFELPSANKEVLPGVQWGAVDAFPTPAYWAYQVLARRVGGQTIRYRLGETLAEEVGACLLGGHGIPASVGVAAFRKLKSEGLFKGTPDEQDLYLRLSEPIEIDGRPIHYRFAKQKSKYLAAALLQLASGPAPADTGKALRNWLLSVPGIGPKTASWVARNWLDADDVAILDIHILRAGALAGFFDRDLSVERDYLKLEEQFLRFSQAIGVRASELDAVIWLEMMSSPDTVRELLPTSQPDQAKKRLRPSAHKRNADTSQARLLD